MLEVLLEQYHHQIAQRNAESAESGTQHGQGTGPWISLIDHQHCHAQDCKTSELDSCASDCDSDLEVYSDSGLQHDWSNTAVDVQVRLSLGSPAYTTIARIDSMSNGCFISRRLLRDLKAPIDKSVPKQFQCPRGILETEGTVALFVYWRDESHRQHRREVRFNVPKEWHLETVDMLVTVPMAEKLGIDKVARSIEEPGNLLAAIERIYGGVFFRRQDKKAKADADKANAVRAQQNLESEAEWKQKRERLRHARQPNTRRQS